MIPILENHDHTKRFFGIAQPYNHGSELRVVLFEAVTKEVFYSIFGNVGFEVLKEENGLIKEASIVEFSIDSKGLLECQKI